MSAQSTPLSSRPNWVGIDVSNAKLDADEIESAQAQRFTNDSKGIEQLHQWLVRFPQASVVCESTGGLERRAAETRSASGIPVSIINAAQRHSFAKASGVLAKTDTLDARTIARYGECFKPAPTVFVSEQEQELKAWLVRRKQLSKGEEPAGPAHWPATSWSENTRRGTYRMAE